jgi:transposase
VFRAKRADRIKLIVWDGTGLCLFAKRLEEGAFRSPKIEDGIMRPTPAQLSALIGHGQEELLDLVRRAESPHALDSRQVVPAAIEQAISPAAGRCAT